MNLFAQADASQSANQAAAVFIGVILLAVYLLPSFIAMIRGHRNIAAIVVLNLLTGWTFIGWVATLVWAFTVSPTPSTPIQVVVSHEDYSGAGGHNDNPFVRPRYKPRTDQERPPRYRCAECKTPILDDSAAYCAGCGKALKRRSR